MAQPGHGVRARWDLWTRPSGPPGLPDTAFGPARTSGNSLRASQDLWIRPLGPPGPRELAFGPTRTSEHGLWARQNLRTRRPGPPGPLRQRLLPSMRGVVSGDVSAAVTAWSGTPADRGAEEAQDLLPGWSRHQRRVERQQTYTSSSFLLSLAWNLALKLLLVTSPGYVLSSRLSWSSSSASDEV